MKNLWRHTLPHPIAILIWVLAYSSVLFIDIVKHVKGEIAGIGIAPREILLVLFAVLHGFLRARLFHPALNSNYRYWLATSPWSSGKPLPLGPVHLIWTDFIIIAILTLLAFLEKLCNPLWNEFSPLKQDFFLAGPAIAFMLTYIVILLYAHFICKQYKFSFIILFGLGFLVYPHRNPFIALGVLFLLYGICYWSYRSYMKQFPWNTDFWNTDPIGTWLLNAKKEGLIGWPFHIRKDACISNLTALSISILITWWIHVFNSLAKNDSISFFSPALFTVLSIVRLGIYADLCRSPISLWGRIRTGRWIIPGYDQIFVAPLCILLTGICFPCVFITLGLKPPYYAELTIFLMIYMSLALGPSLKKWLLTGQYHLRVLSQKKQMPPRSYTAFGEAFNSLFNK